jgi:hypothetical protein
VSLFHESVSSTTSLWRSATRGLYLETFRRARRSLHAGHAVSRAGSSVAAYAADAPPLHPTISLSLLSLCPRRLTAKTGAAQKLCDNYGQIGVLEMIALTLSESSASMLASATAFIVRCPPLSPSLQRADWPIHVVAASPPCAPAPAPAASSPAGGTPPDEIDSAAQVMLVIVISTLAFIVETIPESRITNCPGCEPEPAPIFQLIEKVRRRCKAFRLCSPHAPLGSKHMRRPPNSSAGRQHAQS